MMRTALCRGDLPRIPRDTEIGEHVLRLLAGGHPLTVLRGPRGYGKTSAVLAWLTARAAEPEAATDLVVYVALTTASNDPEGFWSELGHGLAQAQVWTTPGELTAWTRDVVVGFLAERRAAMTLVIDDFHEAGLTHGAATIDDELVDLVRQNDQFNLVIATRTLRVLETTGSLSVDAAVIGPAELRMTGDMVHALAHRLGVDVTMDQAHQVAVDLGGWPSAIRAGLMRSANGDAPGEIDGELVDGYIATMVRDLRYESVRSFLLRTAIPEQFDIEMARAIAPEGNTVRILRNVRAAGLLSERHTVSGQMYSYAPAIRSALIRVMRHTQPDLWREVHLALMGLSQVNRDAGEVLTHAVHAEQWSTALDIIERQWAPLLTAQPLTLIAAAKAFPPHIAQRSARLRVVLDHVAGSLDQRRFGVPDGPGAPGGPGAADGPGAAQAPGVPDVRTPWPVTEYLTFNAESSVDEDETFVLLQWGISSMLGGDLDSAAYAFGRARDRGLERRTQDGALHLGTIGLALVHALAGEPEHAQRWLDEPPIADRLRRTLAQDASDIAMVAASIARALAAVDAGAESADEAVATMIEPRHRDELWALTVFVRAHHAALSGSAEEIFRQANNVRAAMRHITRGSLIEAVLSSTLVELLLVAQMGGVAREVAERFDSNPLAWTAVAKLHLAERAFTEAISYADKAIETPGLSRRAAMECHVILASAHHALGNLTSAHRAFRHSVGIAQGSGQRRPYFLMQRYVFDTLAGDDPRIQQFWPGPRDELPPKPRILAANLPTLTLREVQVLRALEVRAGPVGIAHDLGLSVNTVKTHLQTIYKKFGVSSRNEALAVAEQGMRAQ